MTKNFQKIFEHFKFLRPVEVSGMRLWDLNKKDKLIIAKYVRIWGYLNALSFELAKDLKLNLNDKEMLLNASLLIHNSIFKLGEKSSKKAYQEMHKTVNSLDAWKTSFAEAAEDAIKDMSNLRKKKVDSNISVFPRLDHQIYVFYKRLKNKDKK